MAPLLIGILQIITFALIARAVLSWFRAEPGSGLYEVNRWLDRVTEPIVAPVRRVLPRTGGIDLSILVVLLVINLILVPIASTL
ncbi:MAG: YggT family protein [Acidimicrobiales bacterium]|nr:YggT family protein [Acidimicrobiales bacterium]